MCRKVIYRYCSEGVDTRTSLLWRATNQETQDDETGSQQIETRTNQTYGQSIPEYVDMNNGTEDEQRWSS